jgi:hypothetical protein
MYRTINVVIILYGCQNWPLTFREERRLWFFEVKVLRTILWPMKLEMMGWGIHCIAMGFLFLTPHRIPSYFEGKLDAYKVLVRKPEGLRPFRLSRRRREFTWKCISKKSDGSVWIGFIWRKMYDKGRLLCKQQRNFGVHKMRGNSWIAEEPSAIQEGPCYMGLVIL